MKALAALALAVLIIGAAPLPPPTIVLLPYVTYDSNIEIVGWADTVRDTFAKNGVTVAPRIISEPGEFDLGVTLRAVKDGMTGDCTVTVVWSAAFREGDRSLRDLGVVVDSFRGNCVTGRVIVRQYLIEKSRELAAWLKRQPRQQKEAAHEPGPWQQLAPAI